MVIFTGNNITKQMYERLRKEMNLEHNHPKGTIFHAAAFDETGQSRSCGQYLEVRRGPEQICRQQVNAIYAKQQNTRAKGGDVPNQ